MNAEKRAASPAPAPPPARRTLVRARGRSFPNARPLGAPALTCSECGRTALDVRVDTDNLPRCFAQVGCQGRADRLVKRLAR